MKKSTINKIYDKREDEKGTIEYLVEWHSSPTPKWLLYL